jgi:hypothetical protein
MGYITKNNPIGVDVVINNIIESMYLDLVKYGWTGYEAYHRVFKNPKDNGDLFVPEAFTGFQDGDNDYSEVLLDDTRTGTSFFLTGSSTTYTNGNHLVPLSIIFQLNSVELYPNLGHRADEEARNDVVVALQNAGYRDVEIVTEIANVYNEFDTSNIAFDDMNPYHVFRINLNATVDYSCNYYCTYPDRGGFQYKFNSGLN